MKQKIKKLIDAKRAEEKRLNDALVASDSKEERAEVGQTLISIRNEIDELERILREMDEREDSADDNTGERSLDVVAAMRGAEQKAEVNKKDEAEERAKKFVETHRMTINNSEQRSILVASGQIATPTGVDGINDMFAYVSSIVDLVKVTDAQGMGAYKVAFVDDEAAAAPQAEGASYSESEPAFDFVTITPTTYAILSYISKQVMRQSPLMYEAKVRESALRALRVKAAEAITGAIVGSALTGTVSIGAAIDEKTLRKIAFGYGGDDGVVGPAVLFLNKKDLVAFGDVRGTANKNAVYEITPDAENPNTGIIRDGGLAVKYCLDSHLTDFGHGGTMLYGQPENFELALFSPYEILVSEDFAFDRALLAIRGDVEMGGAVVKKNGFIKAIT